jgi:hypothetical protein
MSLPRAGSNWRVITFCNPEPLPEGWSQPVVFLITAYCYSFWGFWVVVFSLLLEGVFGGSNNIKINN